MDRTHVMVFSGKGEASEIFRISRSTGASFADRDRQGCLRYLPANHCSLCGRNLVHVMIGAFKASGRPSCRVFTVSAMIAARSMNPAYRDEALHLIVRPRFQDRLVTLRSTSSTAPYCSIPAELATLGRGYSHG
jgi:hypothetical protein